MAQIDIGTKLISALRRYSALMCDCRTVGTKGQAGGVIAPPTPILVDQLALLIPTKGADNDISTTLLLDPPLRFSYLPTSLD